MKQDVYYVEIVDIQNVNNMATKRYDELKWQAESDAITMAQYQEIMADKARMGRAIKAAQKEANNLEKRASAMKAAASTKTKKR